MALTLSGTDGLSGLNEATTFSLSGQAVSISGDGDTAIIGVKSEDTTASNAGAAYIFVE